VLVYEYEGRVDELAEYLEDRLLSYLPEQDEPEDGEIAKSVSWFPSVFPWNRWPVQGTSELYQDGRARLSDVPTMPGVIAIGWRVHAISLVGKRNPSGSLVITKEGRQEARDKCRMVFANWRQAFLGDIELEKQTNGLVVGRAESGDKDRHGTFYEEVTSVGTRIIWIHQCEALIYL
jgi:hypothetical protein